MLLVVDGNHTAYRILSGRSFPSLSTRSGRPTGIIFGFVKSITAAVNKFQPEKVVVCWDVGRSGFRKHLYPAYKANRHDETQTPQEEENFKQYLIQMDELKKLLPFLGIEQYWGQDVEADDLISLNVSENQGETTIMSGDKDFLQLVSSKCRVFRPIEGVLYDLPQFTKEFDLTPIQYLHARVLIGDESDNIKGVPGIGKKYGPELIRQYGDIWHVMTNAPNIAQQKKFKGLIEHFEVIPRNLMLMDLRHSRAILGDKEPYRHEATRDMDKVKKVFMSMEFFSMLKGWRAMENTYGGGK